MLCSGEFTSASQPAASSYRPLHVYSTSSNKATLLCKSTFQPYLFNFVSIPLNLSFISAPSSSASSTSDTTHHIVFVSSSPTPPCLESLHLSRALLIQVFKLVFLHYHTARLHLTHTCSIFHSSLQSIPSPLQALSHLLPTLTTARQLHRHSCLTPSVSLSPLQTRRGSEQIPDVVPPRIHLSLLLHTSPLSSYLSRTSLAHFSATPDSCRKSGVAFNRTAV